MHDLTVGTNNLYVSSSTNRVGIGTTTPNAELTIWSDGSAANLFEIANQASTTLFKVDSLGNASTTGDFTIAGDDLFMTTNSDGYMLIADGTNFNPTAMQGDATIIADGTISVSDLTIASEARGDLLTFSPGGVGGWERLAAGTAGYYLKSDGTDIAWATVTATAADCTPDGGVQYEVAGAFTCEAAFYYTQASNVLTVAAIGVGAEEVVIFTDVASALNEITITNAATTAKPSIIPSGETNVGLIIDAKGTGEIIIGSGDAKFSLVSDALDISNAGAMSGITTIGASGDITTTEDLVVGDAKYIGSTSAPTAMQISSGGIVTFLDDILIKDVGTIGSASDPDAITIAADGKTTFTQDMNLSEDLLIGDAKYIGSASDPDAIQIEADGDIIFTQDLDVVVALTAGSIVSDAGVGGTTITASTGFALGDTDYIGITGNEIITFNAAGTIVASGAVFSSTGGEAAQTPLTGASADFLGNFTGAYLYGGTYIANSDSGDSVLPVMAAGMNFCIITLGAIQVVVDTNAADGYLMDGTTGVEGANITNLSAAGDIACFQYYTADDWLITTNGWTPE